MADLSTPPTARSRCLRSQANRATLGIAAATLSFVALPSAANACFSLPTIRYGSGVPDAAYERRMEQKREAAVRRKQAQFRKAVRAGKIESAAGLAELLIPNVRQAWLPETDCGPTGDADAPPVPRGDIVAAAFAGTELDGLGGETLFGLAPAFVRGPLDTFTTDCNAEFRAHFADRLRMALPRRRLEDALLVLSGAGEREHRYYRFADAGRRTRPKGDIPPEALARLRGGSGKALLGLIDAFWSDASPQLASSPATCPNAHRQVLEDREVALERLRAKSYFPGLVRNAARGRTGGQSFD